MNSLQSIFLGLSPALHRFKIAALGDSGCTTWVFQAKNGWQIVIMQFKKDSISDEFHTNDCSQWGVVLDGEMSLWSPRKRVLRKGDTFFIPKGTPHRVAITAGYKDITIFDGQRYNFKQAKGQKGEKKCEPPRRFVSAPKVRRSEKSGASA